MAGLPFLGSKISLISKSEIRYEGILYTIDTKESTVALAKVRSFGTEDRRTDRPVAPRDEIYEYIVYRGSDIKDIRVCEPPSEESPILPTNLDSDPAIIGYCGSRRSPQFKPVAPFGSRPTNAISQPPTSISGFGPVGSTGGVSGLTATAFSAPDPDVDTCASVTSPLPASVKSPKVPKPKTTSTSRPAASSKSKQPSKSHVSNNGQRHESVGRGSSRGGSIRGGIGNGGSHQPVNDRRRFQPPHHSQNPSRNSNKEVLKFESDYDFDKANEAFKSVLEKLQKTSISSQEEAVLEKEDDKEVVVSEEGVGPTSQGDKQITKDTSEVVVPAFDKEDIVFYDKSKSFFDSISCDANDRDRGGVGGSSRRGNSQPAGRSDWRNEKKINRETFGETGGFYNNRIHNNQPQPFHNMNRRGGMPWGGVPVNMNNQNFVNGAGYRGGGFIDWNRNRQGWNMNGPVYNRGGGVAGGYDGVNVRQQRFPSSFGRGGASRGGPGYRGYPKGGHVY